jgi:hypothetical protein
LIANSSADRRNVAILTCRLPPKQISANLPLDGTTVTLLASSGTAALLGTADRQSLRLMIIGDDGWTFVMHLLMGVATLDEDPASS